MSKSNISVPKTHLGYAASGHHYPTQILLWDCIHSSRLYKHYLCGAHAFSFQALHT